VIPLLLPLYPQLCFKPEERVLTLAAEGIVTTIGKRSGTIPWSTVRNVRDEGAVMIERLNGNAFAVPARAFATIEERRAFIAFATSAAANA
jgi:ArsR family metal-binding transcriptional regulator